ncbi:MAG: hypothetical protein UFX20_12570 [Longibaculum muris]|uniref:Uncharacterized protein n=1 Tax=Longibaculum muris TaxID=1796628 RepID=A0A4R3Z2K7_9FIRM|nr:hypothetical protein [Longibaculum muris]KXU42512.1 hypothetical protein HMPREF3037_02812 [Candidatus Stoquefichus sp. KLE1796]MBS5368476.1 hypothetical protein [Coprobacillus cateniformis]MCR1887913.1 hypothetical protein [Longibaculum muris]MED9812922.1 hypothetical protein [Longibaculum muris]TCV98508.1 hypothetical protein EDD60_1123 [Longibaculum muris]
MKCKVCGTWLPLGVQECPNCGWKINDQHGGTNSTQQTRKKSKKWLLGIFLFIVMIVGLVNYLPSFVDHYRFMDFEKHTFEELLDNGYNEDPVLLKVIEKRDNVKKYFDDILDFDCVYTKSSALAGRKYIDLISFVVSGEKDGITYYLSYRFDKNGENTSQTLGFDYYTNVGIHEKLDLQTDSQIIHSLAEYIQVNDADDLLKQAYQVFKKNDDHMYEGRITIGNKDICIDENELVDSQVSYHINGSISCNN